MIGHLLPLFLPFQWKRQKHLQPVAIRCELTSQPSLNYYGYLKCLLSEKPEMSTQTKYTSHPHIAFGLIGNTNRWTNPSRPIWEMLEETHTRCNGLIKKWMDYCSCLESRGSNIRKNSRGEGKIEKNYIISTDTSHLLSQSFRFPQVQYAKCKVPFPKLGPFFFFFPHQSLKRHCWWYRCNTSPLLI